jgi:hypothetical protein
MDVMWFILGVSTLRFFVSLYSVCPVPIVQRGIHVIYKRLSAVWKETLC